MMKPANQQNVPSNQRASIAVRTARVYMYRSDFLIVGAGIAGLSLALKIAQLGSVQIVAKREASDSNTNFAQGGIASVLARDDSFDLHIGDTLRAGVGLCREPIVEMVVREGPERIAELIRLGVEFTRTGRELSLGREGGHSRNRIVHCQDLTGREMERILLERVEEHPRIQLFPHHMAVNLITSRQVKNAPSGRAGAVYGAYVLDVEVDRIVPFASRRTILATGGAGKVYLYTSNPDIATGDGIAMAYHAGARIANLEFVQFHPTCLYHPEAKSFLLSEALRGEGGKLIGGDGRAFMGDYHEQADLAPRDVVARAIDNEMKRSGSKCVFLDLTHLDKDFIRRRFPHIYSQCLKFGIDITAAPIPVVPATHYFCGGVDVDEWGRTNLENLYAIGEVAHTGLHGANRLASNSLLEAVTFAHRAYLSIKEDESALGDKLQEPEAWREQDTKHLEHSVIVDHDWDSARRVMWDYVGIVRNDQRLEIAADRMAQIQKTMSELYWNCRLTKDILELRNIVLVGELIIASAKLRKESRGLHYTETYPHLDDRYRRDTILQKEVN
jgi:L-aspartate oxidase